MFKLVVCVLLIAVAVASAQLLAYPSVVSSSAYGVHTPYSVSSSSRFQINRSGALIAPGVIYG